MNLLTLDWETFYGKDYTLSRMTNEEYIRDPRFKAHGIGLKLNDKPAKYFYEDIEGVLAKIPWHRVCVLSHHAHFDMAILSWVYGYRPKFILDTLSMFRALYPWESASLANMSKVLGLGEKGIELANFKDKWELTDEEQQVMGGYCRNDVELTHAAFEKMKVDFPLDELRLIDLTVRMFSEPVMEVEPCVLIEDYKRERRTKRALVAKCVADKEELASNDRFAEVLLTLGVDPPKKLSPSKVKDGRVNPREAGESPVGMLPSFKAPKGASKEEREALKGHKNVYPWAYAFGKSDEAFKMLQDHEDPRVQAVVEARLGVKSTIKETRTKRFYKIGSRGAFPVYLNYYGAHTGRWSGGDKQNAQNLNRVDPKDPTSGALRRSLLAPPGHMVVVRDLGQIEARVLAYWAGQEDLIELFRNGGDPYNRQASLIFGYEVDRKQEEFWLEGLAGKASTLGNGYGMGWGKFQEGLRVGFMGMPSLLFGEEAAGKIGADINLFCAGRSYKPGFATLREEALSMKPLNVDEEAHLWHCAATKAIVDGYRQSNPAVVGLWKSCGQALGSIAAGDEVWLGERPLVKTCAEGLLLPNGMKIQYHHLKANDSGQFRYLANRRKKEYSYIYGGKVVENAVQALSRIIIAKQKLRVAASYNVVTSTHDEIVCVVPEDQAQECYEYMGAVMAEPPEWCGDLPLKSSGGWAGSYGECEK